MPSIPPSDSFRSLHEVQRPDPRWATLGVSLKVLHQEIDQLRLTSTVPTDVQVSFENARNLLLYAWYAYRFQQAADSQACASLEMALRLKLNYPPKKKLLHKLLGEAIKKGLLLDQALYHTHRLRTSLGSPVPTAVEVAAGPQETVQRLVQGLLHFRNTWAHGSAGISTLHLFTVAACCDLINQLFPEIPAASAAPAS